MKCQILFSRKNKKNIISLSSAESAHKVVSLVSDDNSFPQKVYSDQNVQALQPIVFWFFLFFFF